MITTVSRGPSDNFTYDLFQNVLSQVDCDYEAYYIWTSNLEKFKTFLSTLQPTKSNVILGIKDLLNLGVEYNYWNDAANAGIDLLNNLAQRNSRKTFIIFTSLENASLETTNSNIQFVPWGGDVTNQSNSYPTLNPVLDKNFKSTHTFISLNRHARSHRIVLLSYLFGMGYDQYGDISYLDQHPKSEFLDYISWQFDERHSELTQVLANGYQKINQNQQLITDNYEIYNTNIIFDNVANFNNKLRNRYQHSFVEVVSESSFESPSFMITEKFLNSVYGCNFPILLSGVGAVEHLRQVGFDLFDDIVDHSYDTIANPIDRVVAAIETNRQLLTDLDYVKQKWQLCKTRFGQNIAVAQTTLYQWYQDRAISKFNAIEFN
jgi:hypothetical protein